MNRPRGPESWAPWLATLLWVASFLFSLATLALLNDHFGRISPARQIVAFGELPFRDFFDPGYFLTELTSAAMQRLLGDNLLGETLLSTVSIATGTVLVAVLARRLTGSTTLALAVSLVALLSAPRAYDYDKVLFYPLGILLCWRYVERPSAGRLWALAAGLVAGALFRYDTGAYLGVAGIVSIAAVHAREWGTAGRRSALFLAAVLVLAAPAAAFVELNGGILNAIDQVATYARRETARTALPSQRFSRADPVGVASATGDTPESPSTADARPVPRLPVWILPGWWTAANANVLVYFFLRALPLACVLVLLSTIRSRGGAPRTVNVLGLVTVCVLLNVFILRDPISARVGGMAGPPAILSAWLVQRAWLARNVVARASVVAVSGFITWGVLAGADWHDRLAWEYFRPAHVLNTMRLYAASPPDPAAMPNPRLVQMIRYLRECTGPADRILLGWFAPEVYFFAQRGFAGGMVAVFGKHWSERRFQERSVRLLASQSVPIIIVRAGDESIETDYPVIARFLNDHYREAGTTDFGDSYAPAGYTVLVNNDRAPAYTHPTTSMPCFW